VNLLIKDEHSLALTVGAGGTIKQTIVADKNNPRIWDVASAKLINIQLVNSSVFELITGLVTPSTPVTYTTYAAAGLPFYDIYKEKPSKVSGSFSKVKTVTQIDDAHDIEAAYHFDPLKSTLCSHCRSSHIDSV